MNDAICTSYFKDGRTNTTTQSYTAAWVQFINQLERSRAALSSINKRESTVPAFPFDETETTYGEGRHLLPPV